MKKGSQLSVAGRIETRSYEAKEGGRRYVTEVVADEVSFLDSKKNSTSHGADNSSGEFNGDMMPIDDGEDMPF